MPIRREFLTWSDVDKLMDYLLPQFRTEYEAMVIITRGGLIPGGLLAQAMNITHILTAAVDFPHQFQQESQKLMAWPEFIQFPAGDKLAGRNTLVVDDVWGSGRTITAVKNKIVAARGTPEMCVLHFNPYRSLFTHSEPDYYAAVTDAFIVYPWEVDRGADLSLAGEPQRLG
ncbi:MAG: phosphoribosyltransferase [Chloroflexi bacterium]|nr:phosphoribosyltransferase [Chloroflexota bacterium]